MEKGGGLRSSYIANCVFNALLSYTAIMINSVTIHAIRTTPLFSKPLKTLLLSLAVSDLGVGLIVQPLNIVLLVMDLQPKTENDPAYKIISIAFYITVNLFLFASFFGVMALSLDRFLAIHLHLRYQEVVTHRRVVVGVISVWVFSTFLSLIRPWISENIIWMIFAIIEVACVIAAAFLNYKIYVAVQRHSHQLQVLHLQQVAQTVEMASVWRLRKSAVATVSIYLVFLVCYLPDICMLFVTTTISEPNTALESLLLYINTLVFLNSSLNPLIYCWNMRHIRQTMMNILRNALSSHN